jgi:hypothetical protein
MEFAMMSPFTAARTMPQRQPRRDTARAARIAAAERRATAPDRLLAGAIVLAAVLSLALWATIAALLLPSL